MCGIAGKVDLMREPRVRENEIRSMLGTIRHRGPDQFGIYLDERTGLGSARLSIIDLEGGQQPICNEDGSLWIVFNGEIFNYLELRKDLEAGGHRFSTTTDTEVILHLYEECGPDCLNRLNGQFAIAIWDRRDESLFLARDRVGIRPLFYTRTGRAFLFASEMKAILATGEVQAHIDPTSLDQIFTYWSTLSPRTIFTDIDELPPGHFLILKHGEIRIWPYWSFKFCEDLSVSRGNNRTVGDYIAEFEELLIDATKLRLRADVPVGAYLSGGLDSSTIAAIISRYTSTCLDTFSIAFSDTRFDESQHQVRMAKFLGTEHQVVHAKHSDIGRVFPEVIWHTETPIMRTSPAPMFLLSKLARSSGYKVVLTGEGADEILAGYDIFKEAKIRRFWARESNSKRRPLLLKRLYPDISELSQNSDSFIAAFFGDQLGELDTPDYSHAIRWRNNRRTRRFFSEEMLIACERHPQSPINYPPQFENWGPLERAQFLESTIFLSQYLLSSQGDRMGMANSVEGRFPFLDYRVIEYCNRLPSNLKLRGLTEKYLLKKFGEKLLPKEIWTRTKKPYRAPIHRSFFNDATPDYVHELLSPAAIKSSGFFKPGAVSQLVKKIESNLPVSETDDMALAGILSTQLVHRHFVSHFRAPTPISVTENLKVCHGSH